MIDFAQSLDTMLRTRGQRCTVGGIKRSSVLANIWRDIRFVDPKNGSSTLLEDQSGGSTDSTCGPNDGHNLIFEWSIHSIAALRNFESFK